MCSGLYIRFDLVNDFIRLNKYTNQCKVNLVMKLNIFSFLKSNYCKYPNFYHAYDYFTFINNVKTAVVFTPRWLSGSK